MPLVRVPALGPYLLDNGSTQTGTGDVWADASDATWIDIPDYGGDVFAFRSSGAAKTRAAMGSLPVPDTAKVWVRMKYSGPLPYSGSIILYGSDYLHGSTAIADPVAGWARSQLNEGAAALVVPYWNDGGDIARIQVNVTTGPVRVYEAEMLFEWSGDAPPCRIWARDDEFGVGAGRNYPPPKSQQRSSRGVGYY